MSLTLLPMTHPDVFPFVRHKANSLEEYLFMTKQTIEDEERGEMNFQNHSRRMGQSDWHDQSV